MELNIIINLQKEPLPDNYVKFHIDNGFVNSPCVLEYYEKIKNFNKIMENININNYKSEKYNYYNSKYPDYKFIHNDDISTFADNYKIIKNNEYTHNIPTTVISKIETQGKVKDDDIRPDEFELVGIEDLTFIKLLGKEKPIFTQKEINDLFIKSYKWEVPKWTENANDDIWLKIVLDNYLETHTINYQYKTSLYNYKSVIWYKYSSDLHILRKYHNKTFKLFFDDYFFFYCKDGILLVNF